MLDESQENQLSLEMKKFDIEKKEQYIVLIYDDFLLEETLGQDLNKYKIKGFFYDENTIETDVLSVQSAACYLVDGSVYDKNKSVLKLIKKLNPETNIILVTNDRLKDQSLNNTENVFTVIQEYQKNKLTLLLAIRNAVASFISNSIFERHIKAFENYTFYLRENDLLNSTNIVKNLNNYFDFISDVKNDFRYAVIENDANKPFLIGGTETLVKEFKRKNSKEATILKTLFKKTIEEQRSLDCPEYNTFYFSDLYGNSVVFILHNLHSLTHTNKRLCELLIATATNFLFIIINERKKSDFYLNRLIKLSEKVNPFDSDRDLKIFNSLFQDIKISYLSQNRVLFYHLSSFPETSIIDEKCSDFFGEKLFLNRDEQDIYHLFLLIKEKKISKEGVSEAEKKVPPHLLKPIVDKYSQYSYI